MSTLNKTKKINKIEFLVLIILLLWIGVRYTETLNHLHPEWSLLAIGLGIAWCLRYSLYVPLILLFLIAGLLIHHWWFDLPSSKSWIEKVSSQHQLLLVNGKIIERTVKDKTITLHLSSVEIRHNNNKKWFPEIYLSFSKNKIQTKRFYRSRLIEIIGVPRKVSINDLKLQVELKQIRYRDAVAIENDLSRTRESWVMQLQERAMFYLSPTSLSLYLPLALAKKSYNFRSTSIIFQQSGMAHVLAISGLHIGLIYGLFLGTFLLIGRFSLKLLLHPSFHNWSYSLALFSIWVYLFLIGAPIPALRAVCMLSLLVFRQLLGQAHLSLHALFTTAIFFIFLNPAVIYEISFQLSFLAVLYILWFLPLLPLGKSNDALWIKLAKYSLSSVCITASVMLGTWPIVASTFARLSLETFWLNLIMVVLLGTIVLPCCLLALIISMISLNSLPFGFFEKNIFALTEWVVQIWFQILNLLHQWGSWASFSIELNWETHYFLAYYGITLWGGKWLIDRLNFKNQTEN